MAAIRTQKFIPTGNITSTSVPAALAELDSLKEPANPNIVKKNVATVMTAPLTLANAASAFSGTGTFTFDGASQVREISLTGTGTITMGAPTGIVQNTVYTFVLKAGDTSARSIAFNAAFKFPGGVPANTIGTLTTTSGAYDTLTFIGGASNTLIFAGCTKDCR